MKLSTLKVIIIIYTIINGTLFIYSYALNPLDKKIELTWLIGYAGIMFFILFLQLFFIKKKTAFIVVLQFLTTVMTILYYL